MTSRLPESCYVAYLLIVSQLLLNDNEFNSVIASVCQEMGLSSGVGEGLGVANDAFFSGILSSLLRSFDSAGGGAIGYVRRSLFVQCMLLCIMRGSQELLYSLEQVTDCIVNVLLEVEVGEEKMRLLFLESSMGSAGNYSKEYLKCFVSEVNVQQYWGSFMQVRADGVSNA